MAEENRKNVGNLTDFVAADHQGGDPFYIQVSVNGSGKVVVFYDKPLSEKMGLFEYSISSNRLIVEMDGGERRDSGLELNSNITKHMQNTHQILTILMDNSTGEAVKGDYVPLILHRS